MRLPVAAKIALHSAGARGGTGGSPTPPQKPPLGTMLPRNDAVCQLRTPAVQQGLMIFQRRLRYVATLAGTASLGAFTIRGSRIVKVDPWPGSLATVMSPPII